MLCGLCKNPSIHYHSAVIFLWSVIEAIPGHLLYYSSGRQQETLNWVFARCTHQRYIFSCQSSWQEGYPHSIFLMRGGWKISGLFMLLSFQMQLPTHIIHVQKLHFIDGKLVSLFSISSVYTQSFEHLNKVGVRATMDSKLEEQRSVLITRIPRKASSHLLGQKSQEPQSERGY